MRQRHTLVFAYLIGLFLGAAGGAAQADETVALAQRALRLAGYDAGPIDGVWGPATSAALAQALGPESAPRAAQDISPATFDELSSAFNRRAEADEADVPHLQVRLDEADARHLLERTGIGANPVEIAELVGLTRSAAISLMIQRMAAPDPVVPLPASLSSAHYPHYWSRWDLDTEARTAFAAERDRDMTDFQLWWVRQMISTPHPQAERLLLVWHNHFVSSYRGMNGVLHPLVTQHMMFRQRANGDLETFLTALLRDAAMLTYLDNVSNRASAPNENLARELLELFTLGLGAYDDHDVKEVARALTGNRTNALKNHGFDFASWMHDDGTKTILGRTGAFDADDVIDILLAQPAAAEHFAAMMWRAYISEFNTDPDAIDQIASTFRASGYEFKALVRATLSSPAFWSDEVRLTIVKSPVDLIVGTIRSSGQLPEDWQILPSHLETLGQSLFDAPDVSGWPGASDWVGAARLVLRREVLAGLVRPPMEALLPPAAQVADDRDTLFIHYAAQDFEGAPEFEITAMDGSAEIWRSGPIRSRGGIDTALIPATQRSNLPWQTLRLAVPDSGEPDQIRITFLNDHCCGIAGAASGDRNLYVDWIAYGGHRFDARSGHQVTDCGSSGPERAGDMFCTGTLDIPLDPPQQNLHAATAATIDRVTFEWADPPEGSDWASFTLGLLHTRIGEAQTEAMRLSVVRQRLGGADRLKLVIDPAQCQPDCLGIQGSPIALVLLGDETSSERAQWQSLTEAQRTAVQALALALPDLIAAAKNGRNWQERNAEATFALWRPYLDPLPEILAQMDSRGIPAVTIVPDTPRHAFDAGMTQAPAALGWTPLPDAAAIAAAAAFTPEFNLR